MRTRTVMISVWVAGLAMHAGCSATPEVSVAPGADHLPRVATCEAGEGAGGLAPVEGPLQSSSVALARFDAGPLGGKTLALIADEDAERLAVVDVDGKKEVATHALPGAPSQVMVMPDGRVLVTIRSQNQIAVFHPADRSVLKEGCSVETGAEPIAMTLTPDQQTLLVTMGWGKSLEVFGAADLSKKARIDLPREPRAVVVDDDGKFAYVSHAVGGRVSVVDLSTLKAEPTLDVLVGPTRTPDGDVLAVPGALLNSGEGKPGVGRVKMGCQGFPMVKSTALKGRIFAPQVLVDPGDPENPPEGYGKRGFDTEVPSVAVIDAGTRRFVEASLFDSSEHLFLERFDDAATRRDCLLPRAAAVDAASRSLLVACQGIDALVAYDAASASPTSVKKASWDVPSGPSGVAVLSREHKAIVWSQFARSLEIIDLSMDGESFSPTKQGRIALGALPGGEISPQLANGRRLFHATGDARISKDGRACASCHPDGRDDAITWATPSGPRRTIMLAGRVSGTPPFSWNGDRVDLRAHVETAFERLEGKGLRNVEFDALLAYVESLPAPPREGASDASLVARGSELFHSPQSACASCHLGGGTDQKNHDLGLRATADGDVKFNTPSLSYLSGRGPYFHDGRYGSVRDVLRGSRGSMGHTEHLSDDEMSALEAYLNTL